VKRVGSLALAGGVVAAVVAIVLIVLLVREEGPPSPSAPSATTAGTGATAPEVSPTPPAVPPWGDFPGAPADVATPPGGETEVAPVAGGEQVTLRRVDGSPLAVVRVDDSGAATDARYFDRAGRLTVVVSALRAAPAPATSGVGAVVRCGSAARADAGFRWTRFPIRWRLSTVAAPPGVRRPAALAAIRKARGVWNATRSHCRGLRDESRARFLFAGSTPRRVARDGVSTVDVGSLSALGGVCLGAVACTITWVAGGNRATESDARITRTDSGGFSTARRPAPRRLDVQSVMVHESGHTLGFGHVSATDVVMNPFLRRGGTSGRLLGRGDALESNAKY